MKNFRLLRAEEIECRVSRCNEKGANLLLYKTARTDADLLDETVGPENWQNDFEMIDGVLYGGIGIKCGEEWIWKRDAGTESNTEAEKGRASDAFKRAGFKWGIGRELYSSPSIFIPAGKCTIKDSEKNGKKVYACYDKFDVYDIEYESEKVSYLRITLKGNTVFEWGEPKDFQEPIKDPEAVYADDLICADCGRPIRDGKKKDGSPWKAAQIAKYTMLGEGRQLCFECGMIAAAKAAAKREKANA